MIKHDVLNHNDLKLGLSNIYVCLFCIFIQITFGFFTNSFLQTEKTPKIGYNWIFIIKIFLKTDEKTYLRGLEMV